MNVQRYGVHLSLLSSGNWLSGLLRCGFLGWRLGGLLSNWLRDLLWCLGLLLSGGLLWLGGCWLLGLLLSSGCGLLCCWLLGGWLLGLLLSSGGLLLGGWLLGGGGLLGDTETSVGSGSGGLDKGLAGDTTLEGLAEMGVDLEE